MALNKLQSSLDYQNRLGVFNMPRLTKQQVEEIRQMELSRLACLTWIKKINHAAQAKIFRVNIRVIERIHYNGVRKFPRINITDNDIDSIIKIEKLRLAVLEAYSKLTRQKQADKFNLNTNSVTRIHNGETWSGFRRNKDGIYNRVYC